MKRVPISRRPSARKRRGDAELAVNRRLALARDRFECRAVGQVGEMCCDGPLVVHHRLPRSQGGGHDLENLLTLCDAHHRFVHANPTEAFAAGWLLHSWDAA